MTVIVVVPRELWFGMGCTVCTILAGGAEGMEGNGSSGVKTQKTLDAEDSSMDVDYHVTEHADVTVCNCGIRTVLITLILMQ